MPCSPWSSDSSIWWNINKHNLPSSLTSHTGTKLLNFPWINLISTLYAVEHLMWGNGIFAFFEDFRYLSVAVVLTLLKHGITPPPLPPPTGSGLRDKNLDQQVNHLPHLETPAPQSQEREGGGKMGLKWWIKDKWSRVKTDVETAHHAVKHGGSGGVRPVKCVHSGTVRAAEEMKVITVSVEWASWPKRD